MGDNEQEVVMATADSVFMNFFNIRLLKGTVNFLKENDPEIAITEEFARKLFGSEEDALGKEVELSGRPRKIGAIVSGWSRHSNDTDKALCLVLYQIAKGYFQIVFNHGTL